MQNEIDSVCKLHYANATKILPRIVEKVPIQSSFSLICLYSSSKQKLRHPRLWYSFAVFFSLSYLLKLCCSSVTQIQLFLSYLLEFSCSSVTQFHLYLSYSNPLHTRHFHFSLRIAFISLVPQIFFFGSFLYFHSSNHFLSLLNSSSSSSYPLS